MQPVDHEPTGFADLLATDGVVEICELRSSFGFMAFHGGNLERLTDQIASEAAARSGASFYGVLQPTGLRRHLPSATVDPAASPALASFIDHCRVVVAMHGFGRRGWWTSVLMGGRNRDLATHVSDHLRRALPAFEILDDLERIPKNLRGQHPRNPVNLPIEAGVQIELPPRLRGLTPMAMHWPGATGRFPLVEDLITALADAASSWPLDDPVSG